MESGRLNLRKVNIVAEFADCKEDSLIELMDSEMSQVSWPSIALIKLREHLLVHLGVSEVGVPVRLVER